MGKRIIAFFERKIVQMQYVTADTHFLDEHLLGIDQFAPRPFTNVESMDQTIINHWNARVTDRDIIYHLGDIAVYFAKPQRVAYQKVLGLLQQLNGHLILIKGNHDSRGLFKYLAAHNYLIGGQPKFTFHDVGALIKYNHRQYYLTHYPMILGIAPQIINLHGHIHHYAVPAKRNLNVGIDSPEFDYLNTPVPFGTPLNFTEVEEMINGKFIDFEKRQ